MKYKCEDLSFCEHQGKDESGQIFWGTYKEFKMWVIDDPNNMLYNLDSF